MNNTIAQKLGEQFLVEVFSDEKKIIRMHRILGRHVSRKEVIGNNEKYIFSDTSSITITGGGAFWEVVE